MSVAAHSVAASELDELLAIVPAPIADACRQSHHAHGDLIELALDLGRRPEARFAGASVELECEPVSHAHLEWLVNHCEGFADDNRAGIARTLHRISVIRNRRGDIVGATCRVGRAIRNSATIIADLIGTGQSVLLLGPPGVGKTTMLRECARILSTDSGKRVVIVDTSNEIGGSGDIPHPGIGRSRRMQVANVAKQHGVMIEAVENHMPEVIVVDEIGTDAETKAARTIAERGVQLIATAHGRTLENLIANPTLNDLVGGIQSVTLSDEEAKRRGTQKSVLERRQRPTFDVIVEMQSPESVVVHRAADVAVDSHLRGKSCGELRTLQNGTVVTSDAAPKQEDLPAFAVIEGTATIPPRRPRGGRKQKISVFGYGLSRQHVDAGARRAGISVQIVGDSADADLVLTIRRNARRNIQELAQAQQAGVPIEYSRTGSVSAIADALNNALLAQNVRTA